MTIAYPAAFHVAEAGLGEDERRAIDLLPYSYIVRRAVCGLTTDRFDVAMGNGMFEARRTSVAVNLLALNKWFTSRGEWNEAAIEERSAELAERAIGIWPHPTAVRG